MWLLVRIIWSNTNPNLCEFYHWTNECLVNQDKLTIGQMMGPNLKSSKLLKIPTANVSLYNLTKNRNVVGGVIVLTYFLAYFMPGKPQNRGANASFYNLTKNTNASLYNLTKNTNTSHLSLKTKANCRSSAVCCSFSQEFT